MKTKADIFIRGNLLCEESMTGGGIYELSNDDKLLEQFDTKDAVMFGGDVHIRQFASKNQVVVVFGCVAQKGGCDE